MFLLIALIIIIVGIYVLVARNQWAGIAIIAVGILVFLLRGALADGTEDDVMQAVALPIVGWRRAVAAVRGRRSSDHDERSCA